MTSARTPSGQPQELHLDDQGALIVSIGPAAARAAQALLTAAIAIGAGAFVETRAGAFSVIVSGATTIGAGSATVSVQGSHDGITPVLLATVSLELSATAASDGFGSAVPYRYVRAAVTAISGTNAAVNATLGA